MLFHRFEVFYQKEMDIFKSYISIGLFYSQSFCKLLGLALIHDYASVRGTKSAAHQTDFVFSHLQFQPCRSAKTCLGPIHKNSCPRGSGVHPNPSCRS